MEPSLDYAQLVEATRTSVLSYAAQDWPVIKQSSGVQVSSHKPTHTPSKIYKAVGEVNASPSQVFELVVINPGSVDSSHSSSVKKRIQKNIKCWEILKEFDEDVFILRSVSHSAGGGIIASREYFDIVGNFRDFDDGIYITCATGVNYPYPKDSKYVRGWNYPSGIMCFPIKGNPDKCRLVYIIHTDLKGKFPIRLVDVALPSLQVNFISGLNKVLKEDSDASRK